MNGICRTFPQPFAADCIVERTRGKMNFPQKVMTAGFGDDNEQMYRFDGFSVSSQERVLTKAGVVLPVRPQVFDLLVILVQNAGRTVPKRQLMATIWPGISVTEGSLMQLVRELRGILGDDASDPRYIRTQSKYGYRFIAPLQRGSAEPKTTFETKLYPLTTHSHEASIVVAAISPDGRYLAYADDAGLYTKSIENGETHLLGSLKDWRVVGLAWFPDSRQILVSGRNPGQGNIAQIHAVSITGVLSWTVTQDAGDVAVLPNGLDIAFITGNGGELWRMKPDEEPRLLFAAEEGDRFANLTAISDAHLLFSRLRIGDYAFEVHLECLDMAKRKVRILLSDPRLRGYCVSRGGRLIYALAKAASRESDVNLWESRFDCWAAEARGRARRLTNWSGSNVYGLSTSQDGRRVCFLKGPYQADAYVAELQEGGASLQNARRLTLDDRSDLPTAWTPDSESVLFHSDRNGKWEIFKQRLDERSAEVFITGPHDCRGARVTVDGSVLYYARRRDRLWNWTEPLTLMRQPLAGGTPRVVLTKRRLYSVRCAQRTARCVLGERKRKEFIFYVLDPLRGKGAELSRVRADLPLSQSHWDLSPDGSRIAFLPDNEGRIRILHLMDGSMTDVSVTGWSGFQSMDWAADGKGFYVSSQSASSSTLLYINLVGQARILREQLGNFQTWGIPSPNGKHLAFLEWSSASNVWMIENI